MKSPFPGMDPYLERPWRGVHTRLLTYISDALNPVLPSGLGSRIETRVYVESHAGRERDFEPDGYVYRTLPTNGPTNGSTAVAEAATAVRPLLFFDLEPVTDRYLDIVDRDSGGRVVTSIELLSPSNKVPGTGRELYCRKQDECRAAEVNLVEIDLIRGGRPTTVFATSGRIVEDARAAYHVSALDFSNAGRALYFPMPLREPLPKLPIPLREKDQPAVLDLQAVIDAAYERGCYWRDIDYARPPVPPLPKADAEWAAGRIAEWRAANAQ